MSAGPRAVLFDFGGVLTTSVLDAFAAFGVRECKDPGLLLRVLSEDVEAKRLLVEHEEGRLGDAAFEEGLAARLSAYGADVEAGGLIERMTHDIRRDHAMADLVAELRAAGVPVGLVSNSLGSSCYAGWDLPSMFDAVTISGVEGVRKPSRRIYEIGCARLGAAPSEVVMVDDLHQNIVAAQRLGMAGVVHRDAPRTRQELHRLLAGAPALRVDHPASRWRARHGADARATAPSTTRAEQPDTSPTRSHPVETATEETPS